MKRKYSNLPNGVKKIKTTDHLDLPIHEYTNKIIDDISHCDNYIVISTTGSGKTTQIPQILHQKNVNNDNIIAITQPRRLATISIANRVAEEMTCKIGDIVGYSVRFENKYSSQTKIKFMTDGTLLIESVVDPLLSSYSIIILDEAHERSVNNDVLLGVVKNAQSKRREKKLLPLKIIIMSATIDYEPFLEYFGHDTKILSVKTRAHDLKIKSVKQMSEDYIFDSVLACLKLHCGQISVDNVPNFAENTQWSILIFLTGEDEINRCCELLRNESKKLISANKNGLIVFALFAAQDSEVQKAAISTCDSENYRRIIVSTNIAETSITIPGVRVVIDCGFSKQKFVNPMNGLESLVVKPISQAQAAQRAGRAARLGPGICYRLYTDAHYRSVMPVQCQPELMRSNLSSVVLKILSFGFDNVLAFPWLDRPTIGQIHRSMDILLDLGAIESVDRPESHKITKLGRQLLRFPLDPRFALAIIESASRNCLVEVTAVVAVLSVAEKLFRAGDANQSLSSEFFSYDGDLIMLLRMYRTYTHLQTADERSAWCSSFGVKQDEMFRATLIHKDIKKICSNLYLPLSTCRDDLDSVVRCFVRPFHRQVARVLDAPKDNRNVHKKKSTYSAQYRNQTMTEVTLALHPHSICCQNRVPPPLVLYIDCIETQKIFMRYVSVIRPDWVE